MRKLLAGVLVVAVFLCLTGCGPKDQIEPSTNAPVTKDVKTKGGPKGATVD